MVYIGAGQSLMDASQLRCVWNYNNQVRRKIAVNEGAGNWIYSTNAWRCANNNTNNYIVLVVGISEEALDLTLLAAATNSVVGGAIFSGIMDDGNPSAPTMKTRLPGAIQCIFQITFYRAYPVQNTIKLVVL
jgi:hypothetical protein